MVFLDSGFFIAYRNKDDKFHEHAREILARILSGEFSKPYTCDYVLDEAVTRVRWAAGPKLAAEVGHEILTSKSWTMHYVGKDCIAHCVAECSKVTDKGLSFTDQIAARMSKDYGQQKVVTCDRHFKDLGLDVLRLMDNTEYRKSKEERMRSKR
jgi:predicted nucleic acid-binding protein